MPLTPNTLLLLLSLLVLLAAIVYVVWLVTPKADNSLKDCPVFSKIFYLNGHPQMRDSQVVQLYLDQHHLILESAESSQKAFIPRNAISEIKILDKSVVIADDPATLKLYWGYWGYLASKVLAKKSVFELVVRWTDQRNIYHTTFEFTGRNSAENANIAHRILSEALSGE